MSINPLTGPSPEQLDGLVNEETLLEKPRGLWAGAWRRLLRRKGGVVGLFMIGFILIVAILAPLIAPFDPVLDDFYDDGSKRRDPPCVHLLGCDEETPQHLMGLDGNARDEFSRIVFGSRWSLSIGFFTVALAFSIGSTLGAVSGYWGGHLDNWIMRFMDVILGFPALLLAIAIGATLGPGFRNTMIAIAIVSIPIYARVMRASVLSIKELDYVAASRTLGASRSRILLTRVIPNALTPLIVIGTLGIATAILDAAAFGFLGLGAQPPDPEWGAMLASERSQIFSAPHLVWFPGLAIMFTVLGFNLLGDGLRDALDPALNE